MKQRKLHTKTVLLICLAVVWLIALSVIGIFVHLMPSIKDIPVFAAVRTNPPPQFSAALGSDVAYFVNVPYSLAPERRVTEQELEAIRKKIPRLKTMGEGYSPREIIVKSEREISVEFRRLTKPLTVEFVKKENEWHLESISKGGQDIYPNPPRFIDKINAALPF